MPTLLNENLINFIPEKPLQMRSMVTAEENGRKYSLKLEPQKNCSVYQVDGHIVTHGERCDKLVVVETDKASNKWAEVFVELKGRDVAHAIAQLRATITTPIFSHPSVSLRWARIVGQSFPRNTGSSVMERARNEFRKKYNVALSGWSSGHIDRL